MKTFERAGDDRPLRRYLSITRFEYVKEPGDRKDLEPGTPPLLDQNIRMAPAWSALTGEMLLWLPAGSQSHFDDATGLLAGEEGAIMDEAGREWA